MRDRLFGGDGGSGRTDLGLLVLRVYSGLALVLLHGLGKLPPSPGFVGMVDGMGFPAPELFAWLATFAETGGAILLAIGLFTRPTALVLVGHFTFVVLLAHAGDPLGDREVPLFFLASALLFLLAGAGRYSVDGVLRRGGGRARDVRLG